jgi:hypothetical protein
MLDRRLEDSRRAAASAPASMPWHSVCEELRRSGDLEGTAAAWEAEGGVADPVYDLLHRCGGEEMTRLEMKRL